ncbi:unnamed protein product [Auanema sp. JU1783]|nr:unnamed protein product [Auanema sp. JU1783]
MEITVVYEGESIQLHVTKDFPIRTLVALAHEHLRKADDEEKNSLDLFVNSKSIEFNDTTTIQSLGIKQGDVISFGPSDYNNAKSPYVSPPRSPYTTLDKVQKQALQSNLKTGVENVPESFNTTGMAYIRLAINGVEVLTLVDSGAQVSILTSSAAKKCKVKDLIDPRWKEKAVGLAGKSVDALGTIMYCDIKVGEQTLSGPLSVLNPSVTEVDLILGLDFLFRYKAVIDLGKRRVTFDDGEPIEFLTEEEALKISAFKVEED